MKKLNIVKILVAISLSFISLSAYSQWAVSVSAGSADYDLAVTETYTSYTGVSEDKIDDSFLYQDLGIDYSWGKHQIGLKIGGLAKSNGALNITGNSTQAVTSLTGEVEKDELSGFYTYRTDIGVALTVGYYSSEIKTDRNFNGTYNDYATSGSFSFDATYVEIQNKIIENDGFFLGAAYGRALSERTGLYGRLGYQESDVTETVTGSYVFTIPVQTNLATAYTVDGSPARHFALSGDAIVVGVGGYWAVSDNISLNLFYEIKDFDYNDNADNTGLKINLTEEQKLLGLTLRYSL